MTECISLHEGIRKQTHQVDFCVIGGGLAGLFAAVQAAREGAQVLLIHDRPVLGGNASSEIRMWPRGCHGRNNQETGLFEEILCENMYRNPERNYSVWDSVLYGLARNTKGLEVLYNTSCFHAEVNNGVITSVTAWQLTTYTMHTVTATMFADCSGDSILAPITGAEYRQGREGKDEFGESISPDEADQKTMGLTCLIQAREVDRVVSFTPPAWAKKFPDESMFQYRRHHLSDRLFNYWWIELGGTQDSIHDTEEIRDELVATAFGVWDHIKNHGDHGADCFELDWVGFLPGKRESRRYVGAYTLTENDILNEGRFEDIVAYGGWTMDDHDPEGFGSKHQPNIFHPAPAPYGIPYRVLYAKNIKNLFFAGRNISATHAALSSTRVMATCAVMGQAVGMAAAMCLKHDVHPHEIYLHFIDELKQKLMEADCYLPFHQRRVSHLTETAHLVTSDAELIHLEALRDGFDRPIDQHDHGVYLSLNESITIQLDIPQHVSEIRIVFDSDLNRESIGEGDPVQRALPMMCNRHLDSVPFSFPKTMTKQYQIDIFDGARWETVVEENLNYQRLRRYSLERNVSAVRFTALATFGDPKAHIFSIDLM